MKKEKILTIKEFNALPIKEKKILVAKDVLAQIKLGKYIAEQGIYIILDYNENILDETSDIKENFNNITSCNVCALGSAVMSITKFANKLTIDDINHVTSSDNVEKLLLSVFTKKELALMEACFENEVSTFVETKYDYNLDWEESYLCQDFYQGNGADVDPEGILIAIMENIIQNGEFKPF